MIQESGFNHINNKDKELQSGDPSTSPEHTNLRDSSLTFTPEKLQDTLSNRLRGTPITPQQIVKKHLMKTTERMDDIEDAVVTIQEHQNKQQEKLQKVPTKLNSVKIPNLSGLESKITNAIKDKLEEIVGDRLRKDLDYLIEQFSLKTLEVDTGKERIKELEIIIENKNNIIENLHNECAKLKIQLEQSQVVINEEEPCIPHHSDSVIFTDSSINSPELQVYQDNDLELPKTYGNHSPQKTLETHEKIDKYAQYNVRIITEEPENTLIKDEVTGTLDQDNDLELPKTSGNHLPQNTKETHEKIDKYAPCNVTIITEELENTPKKDEVTGTLDKILEEISSLKQMKQDVLDLKEKSNQSYQRFRPTMEKVQMFGDSFFKYVQGSRAFGQNSKVVMNKCFTLDEAIRKLMEMDKDDEVSEVVLQCGFNDIVRERKKPTLSLKLYSNVCSCLKNCS